jgi:glyoxylase-like metal-dependent hydrolase (beta-lactamase superfamily II)
MGSVELAPIHTPGHTDNHFAYAHADRLYTGDALLIEACGRTDFQSGDPAALYHSVRGKLFGVSYDVDPGYDVAEDLDPDGEPNVDGIRFTVSVNGFQQDEVFLLLGDLFPGFSSTTERCLSEPN